MADWWKPYIMARASKYGLDPRAAIAVASQEGLSGGVGDGGHAFGPFQLNDAGGVLTNSPGNHRAFAESKQGIDWALQRMAQAGARGKTGYAAINAIVRNFERPANPDKEVLGARSVYGKNVGGVSTPVSAGNPGGMRPGPVSGPGMSTPGVPSGMPDMRQAFMSMLMQRGQALAQGQQDPGMLPALVMMKQLQRQQAQMPQPVLSAPQTQQASQGKPVKADSYMGQWLKPGAKIIGEPYQGTHTVGNWQSDNAIDISVPVGTPVYAPVGGKLGNTGLLDGQGASGGGRFSGQRINLFGGGNGFYFAHLSKLAPGIAKGATVKKGQLLGYTGEANGVAHLHFGVENGHPSTYYGSKPRR